MLAGGNIGYVVDGLYQGISCGGISNVHQLATRCGLIDETSDRLALFKRHLPYHKSDHILHIAFNTGRRIEFN